MRLVQLKNANGTRRVAIVDEPKLLLLRDYDSTYRLAEAAIKRAATLEQTAREGAGAEQLEVALLEHHAAVRGAGRPAADLVVRNRRDRKAELLPHRGGGAQVGHKMCEVIEDQLARRRALALGDVHAMEITHFAPC